MTSDLTTTQVLRLFCLLFLFSNNLLFAQTSKLVGTGTLHGGQIYTMDPDGSNLERWVDFTIGARPQNVQLIESNGKLWGMTSQGGSHQKGIIFSINIDGSGYTKIMNFEDDNGANPNGSLIEVNGKLWGMASSGGLYGYGVIFYLTSEGTGFTKVHDFNVNDPTNGREPYGNLILNNGKLWGMTYAGGADGAGTVFTIDTDGSNFSVVHSFNHTDGYLTFGSLVEQGNKLWGMTYQGGITNKGTIFSMDNDGTNFTKAHDFDGTNGENPYGSLIVGNNKLWGMTYKGGSSNWGVIFNLNTDGTGFSVVKEFTDSYEGRFPYGDLYEYGNKLYGTSSQGGRSGDGTIFSIDNDGSGYTILKSYRGLDQEGHDPRGTLMVANGRLWGTTYSGVQSGSIFNLNIDGSDFQVVHGFNYNTNGYSPSGRLTESNEKLWGTNLYFGPFNQGTLYTTDIDGKNFKIVHEFKDKEGSIPGPLYTFEDKLWGMTQSGGIHGGTIYHIKNDGSGFTKVHDFDGTNGQKPFGGLVASNGKLWGMTNKGGTQDLGVIFNINPDGSGFTKVHDFNGTNGANPYGDLYEYDGKLWGMTNLGGTNDLGVIFTIDPDGSNYTIKYSFNALVDPWKAGNPYGSLVESNGKLWGKSTIGGPSSNGAIFSINPDGTEFTKVHGFESLGAGSYHSWHYGSLLPFEGYLYGNAFNGGANRYGFSYRIKNDGTGYEKLFDFDPKIGGDPTFGAAFIAVDQNHKPTYSDIPTEEYKEDDTGKQIKLTDYFDDIEDGPSGLIYSVENVTEPSLFSTTPISSGTITLNLAANQFGSTEMTIRGTDTGGKFIEGTFTINIAPVADNPSITTASTQYGVITTSGLKASRNVVDGNEVTHVRITDITNGTLYLSNGSTKVNNNAFVTFSNAINGFKFIPNDVGTSSFIIQASVGNTISGLGGGKIEATISVSKKTLNATANNKSRKYGAANPALTIAYTGFVFGETSTVLNTPPIASTGVGATSNVGIYAISLSSGSDDHYDIVENDGILTISKATLTATANNKTKKYREPNPAFTITYSGFVNAESATVLDVVPVASSTATTNSNAGDYPITLSAGTDGNYEVLLVNGTLNITQRMLSATADNKTKVYGQNNPTLTISYSGFLSGENVDDLDTPLVASTIATVTSNVGNYPIVLSAGTDINYLIKTTDGILSITKASLTAIADNKSKMYGAPIPLLTVSYEGFLNGDGSALIDNPPIPSTSANELSSKGSYTISLSAGSDTNYIISTVNGTLTITKAYLVATADDKTKVYGESNPELTISYEGFALGEDDTVLDNAPVVSTAVLENTFAGEYPINITSGMDDNYNIEVQSGVFTIIKAPLLVEIDNAAKVYGEINPEFVIHYSGFQFDDDELSLDNFLIPTTSANETSDVGEYSITIDESLDRNYDIEVANGILTISKALLTAIAENKSRPYNKVNPELTIAYDGFVNGDTGNDLDEIPSTTTDAKLESDVGTYDISLSGGNDNNYTIELTYGLLTIEKADQVITFNELPDVSINAGSIILEASTSSGLPVSFSSEDNAIATISGDVASLVGLGEVVITANQEGNSNYNPAQSISRTLTIAEITGIEDESLITLNIYPNPANNYFTIDMEHSPVGNIKMISQEGKIIREFEYSENAEYDIRSFTNGLYFVMIETEEKNEVIKKILIDKR